jgi:hypothetical protein
MAQPPRRVHAVRNQLGLKLVLSKGPIRMLVLESRRKALRQSARQFNIGPRKPASLHSFQPPS